MAIWRVRKRSGELEDWQPRKIVNSISKAQDNIGSVDEKISQKIGKLVIAEIEARLVKGQAVGTDEVGDAVERQLIDAALYDIARAYIISRERQRQEERAEKQLGVIDDIGLPYNSVLVLRNKYLQKDENGVVVETPKGCFLRVAKALATPEKRRKLWRDRFFELMVDLRFLPGGRTLANAGTTNGQLANCFVLPFPDSVEEIFEVVKESSVLKKNGGGVGFSFSKIRPKGDVIATTSGRACGPVALMKIVNDASDILLQAGGRRSGNMVVLGVSHPDVFEFITCKEDEGSLAHINYSLGATGKFMRSVARDRDWDLVNPRTGQVQTTVSARSIFELAASLAWRNGDPGVVFLDRINQDNPTPQVGALEAVNLCGEQPLLNYEACNLGSINLAAHLRLADRGGKGQMVFDFRKLEETTRRAVRMLDNVISVCNYPLEKIDEVVKANRKVGIGVMGWADALVRMRVSYASSRARKLAGEVMKFISGVTWDESRKLGKEKGNFPNFEGSIWQKQRRFNSMRNATLTTIAPTGSISMVAGVSYGIEPLFALIFFKEAMGGVKLPEVNEDLLVALRELELDTNGVVEQIAQTGSLQPVRRIPQRVKEVFMTAHDMGYEAHVKMQAAFQKYTDNAVSKTINLPHDARVEDVEGAFMLAWKTGCKGITVYRDASRKSQVLNVGIMQPLSRAGVKQGRKKEVGEVCPQCGGSLVRSEGCKSCLGCGFSICSW